MVIWTSGDSQLGRFDADGWEAGGQAGKKRVICVELFWCNAESRSGAISAQIPVVQILLN